jgi:hypothetical protein
MVASWMERMRAWCGAVRSSVAWLLCIVHRVQVHICMLLLRSRCKVS